MKIAQRGQFIRRFHGPGDGSDIVCFKFWQLAAAMGCPYRCSYCFLQTVPYFRFNPDALYGLVYRNVDDLVAEVERWLEDPVPKMMIVGELQDGLVFDTAYKKVTGRPLTHRIIPLFAAQRRHRLIFLTKSAEVQHALELAPTDRAIFSWSVNAEYVGTTWETGTPPPSKRLEAARRMKAAGWPIRFRLDPMVPYEGWRDGYAAAIEEINALEPEMVTIGALRATSMKSLRAAAVANKREASIFQFLTEEKDPSGFKYRIRPELQLELFRFAIERLAKGSAIPALCKEDRTLWEQLGMKFRGCHCLLGGADPLATDPAGKLLFPSLAPRAAREKSGSRAPVDKSSK